MSALPFELPTQQLQEGPELFDVKEVLADVLQLQPNESVAAINAHNVVYMAPYENRVLSGRGKLAVQFVIEHAETGEVRTKTEEIDDTYRPFPESLITSFGAMALRAGRIERFEFTK